MNVERIAQMVIAKHEQAVWQEVEVLGETAQTPQGQHRPWRCLLLR